MAEQISNYQTSVLNILRKILLSLEARALTHSLAQDGIYNNITFTFLSLKFLCLCKSATAKSLQSCPTLCDPKDGSPPGPIPGILQARTLEWVAISFSNAWKWKVKVKSLSRVWLLATPWTAAHQALRPWDFPGKSTGVGCHCLLRLNH